MQRRWWGLWRNGRKWRNYKFSLGVPTTNVDGTPLTDLAGYKVYVGTASGAYGTSIKVGNVATYILSGLTSGQTYYIAVTTYDYDNNESDYSNEVSGPAK